MPLLEFSCPKCNKAVEKILTFASAAETQFCECGEQLEQKISRPASFKVGKYGKGNR